MNGSNQLTITRTMKEVGMSIITRTIGSGALVAALVLAGTIGVAAQQVGPYEFETLTPPSGKDAAPMYGVAALADGRLGVIGERCDKKGCQWLSWTSVDDGETWEEGRPDIAGRFVDLLSGGDRFFAVTTRGRDAATHKAIIYESTDGLEWTRVSTLRNALVSAAQTTPDGIALLGADYREADGFGKQLAGYPTLWLSQGGQDWTAHEISAPMYKRGGDELQRPEWFGRAPDGSWMASMVHLEFQDERDLRTAVLWHATPDLTWSQVTVPEELTGTDRMVFVRGATPEGFLIGTMDVQGDTSGVWLTVDGSDWEQVADTGAVPHIEQLATPTGNGAIAFKYAYVPPISGEPELLAGSPVFTSVDGRSWEDAGMLEGISVRDVVALDDGRLLVAGHSAPCQDFPSCAFDWEGNDPVLMLGTPIT